jgi:hypothetical protein
VAGTTIFGAGGGTAIGFGGVATAGLVTRGAAGARLSATGAAGRGGAAGVTTVSFFPMMAFKTSPGLEMFDRSILVLMPSASLRLEREAFEDADSERR